MGGAPGCTIRLKLAPPCKLVRSLGRGETDSLFSWRRPPACRCLLKPFVAKYYDERIAPVFLLGGFGREAQNRPLQSALQQGGDVGPAVFCVPLLPALMKTREEYEPGNVEAFPRYLDSVRTGMTEAPPRTVEVTPFLQR